MKNTKRAIAVLVAVSMMIGCAIGGVMAWFIDETPAVTNTFTVGNVDIELYESELNADGTLKENTKAYENSFKMIPGWTNNKDPKAVVSAGSEDCYLFVKVEPSANLGQYISYNVDIYDASSNSTGVWTPLEGVQNVYYMAFDSQNSDAVTCVKGVKGTEYPILGAGTLEGTAYQWGDNQVLVKPDVTKEMMDGLTQNNYPKLTFTAYAVQLYETNNDAFTPAEAWAKIPTT